MTHFQLWNGLRMQGGEQSLKGQAPQCFSDYSLGTRPVQLPLLFQLVSLREKRRLVPQEPGLAEGGCRDRKAGSLWGVKLPIGGL